MIRTSRLSTILNTALTAKYADPEKYHQYVLSRGRDKLARHIARIAKEQAGAKQPTALDLGAGTGIISVALQKESFTVTATDADPTMLEALNKKLPDVKTQVLDINKPFKLKDNSFDAVTTVWANRYITKQGLPVFLSEVHRVLKPGGVLIWPLFIADNVIWKARAGLRQPTTVKALTNKLQEAGFTNIQVDREHKRRNRTTKELPNWVYPVYVIAGKATDTHSRH